ncbi:hypothetical protein [Streptacidiphilus sp. MAP12-16]|uniref:hypothetical protein n=1 Tax=Streptacidiphilus sp. MAP12-16 TaxID=3156300 RepID=UPI0035191F14
MDGVEQAASAMQVPFAVPMGPLVHSLTGKDSTASVTGTLPASPLAPPSAQQVQDHQLIPDPLVPALNTARQTPSVAVSAPVPDADGSPRDGALGMGLPSAPLKAVGSALSLGHPLSWTGPQQGAAAADPSDHSRIDLGDVNPTLTSPELQTAPGGRIDLDQGHSGRPLVGKVSDLLATAAAAGQELKG